MVRNNISQLDISLAGSKNLFANRSTGFGTRKLAIADLVHHILAFLNLAWI